nr:MAG TPA: hypothetical protein [Caudoviricetes sp.]
MFALLRISLFGHCYLTIIHIYDIIIIVERV